MSLWRSATAEIAANSGSPSATSTLPAIPQLLLLGRSKTSMKSLSHPHTPSFPVKLKCCVDRLRAPIDNARFLLRAAGHIFPPLRSKSLPRLTDQGLRKINDLAQHYGVSADAVMTLLQALLNSKGTMAQFDHRELGGTGQWMPGGMTMVGDMFNHGLKAKVDGLCSELSQILAGQPFVPFAASFQSQSQSQGDSQQEGGHEPWIRVRSAYSYQSHPAKRRVNGGQRN